jgi:HSP20 family protein
VTLALMRLSPWQDLLDAQREMEGFVRRFFDRPRRSPLAFWETPGQTWIPAVDVFARDGDLVVKVEIPGIDPEKDLDITVQDGLLRIRGERRREDRAEGDGIYRSESVYGAFERVIPLPDGGKQDDVSAKYEDGILEVLVPKTAQLKGAHRIPVQVNRGRKALTARGRKKN